MKMSYRCLVYLLNMHFSLPGCSIEGRTPSISASVCGGSACMKPRAGGNVSFISICYHQHKSILFYSSTMHWICSVCERFDESVRKFSIVPGHSTNSGWTARQFRAGTGFFFCGLVTKAGWSQLEFPLL